MFWKLEKNFNLMPAIKRVNLSINIIPRVGLNFCKCRGKNALNNVRIFVNYSISFRELDAEGKCAG